MAARGSNEAQEGCAGHVRLEEQTFFGIEHLKNELKTRSVPGGVPENEDDWRWLAHDTNSPYTHIIGGAEPVTIAYRAQYFDRRMRLGPFGDPVVVTNSV